MTRASAGETDYRKEEIRLGRWSIPELEDVLRRAADMARPSDRVGFLSRQFLGVPYQESTLIGSQQTREVLVINLASVDCFTYIDYVEAMRSSRSFAQLKEQLKRVRYRSGRVAYGNRRHFFTDWRSLRRVRDVTEAIGERPMVTAKKVLNEKDDGSCFLPGIKPVARKVGYLPAAQIGAATLARLRNGDYVGMYTETAGLDVSHVGIIVRDEKGLSLRHASSRAGKVIDQDFAEYIAEKPGILILRARG